MAQFPALPLWTDALIGDTYQLTPAEFGAYMRLLIAAWRSPDCCLPDNDVMLGRMIGDPNNWHRVKQRVMSFWSKGYDGHWRQKRLTDELDWLRKKQARSSAGGTAKALKGRHMASAKRLPNACLNAAPTPTPKEASKKDSNGHGVGKRGSKPLHGQHTKDHKRVWLDCGTSEWSAYADDYREAKGHDPQTQWAGAGTWFNRVGYRD